MNERQRRVIVASVTGLAMVVMIGAVLTLTLRDRGALPAAPKQDTNPTGRETPRNGFPVFPNVPSPTNGTPPTPTPIPPHGTLVYERGGTIYLLVLGRQERTLVPAGVQPKIAPDGAHVVYIGRAGAADNQVLLVDTRTRQISVLTGAARDPALPVWSPDGRRIAFRALAGDRTEIFAINVDGTNLQQVTQGPTKDDAATEPLWTADGTAIYYKDQGDGAFYRVPVAGGAPTRIHATTGEQYDLALGPGGGTLAFTQRGKDDSEFGLYLMNADGTNERRIATLLTITAAQQLGGLAWSPDGTAVLVSSGGAFRQEIYDVTRNRPTTTAIAYGAWPSWIAAEITAP